MSQFTCSECRCSKCLEPNRNPGVPAGSTDGEGPKGTRDDVRVDERQELLGTQRRWAGHDAVDPRLYVVAEVEVGVEGEAPELDHSAHEVPQVAEHLVGGLHRCCAAAQ